MNEINIKDVKYDTVYCFYQKLNITQWITFIKLVEQDEEWYIFDDVCSYIVLNDSFNIDIIPPTTGVDVSDPILNSPIDCMHIFEMTEDEIRNHVIMEYI